jgi:hypothetical protein
MTCPAQGLRPVVAQIRGDIDQPGGGTCCLGRQRRPLEFQHLDLVDFVDSGSVGPAAVKRSSKKTVRTAT